MWLCEGQHSFRWLLYQIKYIIQEDVAKTLWNKKAVWPDDIKTIAIQSYHPRGRRHRNPEKRKLKNQINNLKNQINNLQIESHAVDNTLKYPDEVETDRKQIMSGHWTKLRIP